MRGRRALRFAVEALFLGALAAALAVADLSAPAIAGVMLLGWLVVALYEWAATRELPHYGRGLPPRYYVPQVSLPPPRPLEQLPSSYPGAQVLDEEPTWIASPAMRAEMLAEWPVAAGATTSPVEDTIVDGLPLVSLPDESSEEAWLDLGAAERESAWEAEPVAAVVAEPEVVEETVLEPVAVVVATPEQVAEPERAQEPEPAAEVVEEEAPEAAPAPEQPARHSFDPLAKEGQARRPWRRQAGGDEAYEEVPARPPRPARLPSRSRRDD